jgi:valyl-tRNA synthetase
VKVQPLADPAIAAVRDGSVRFVPESWTKTYFAWMENIRDWCISRQLWWGHRIPAFTCPNGHLTVAEEDPEKCPVCGASPLVQDSDVLDTWFSSQLWPFSVFGWPDQTRDLEEFYPTNVLVTGYDILFFWVARMIMAGIHFTGKVPFSTVHLHGLVRIGGEKMSKSKGNVIDPLEAITEFGADAVRFTLASAAASGATVSVERGRMAGSRNFATKVWNAASLALKYLDSGGGGENRAPISLPDRSAMSLPDRWILSRLAETARAVNGHLSEFRFDEAAGAFYAFFWHELCDGYLEMAKPVLSGKEGGREAQESARAVLSRCLEDSLALLHPFMPFITEEIWEKLTGRSGTLVVTSYPSGEAIPIDGDAERTVEALREIVTRVRNFRGDRGAAPTAPVSLWIAPDSPDGVLAESLAPLASMFRHLARLDESGPRFGPPPASAFRDIVAGVAVAMELPEQESSGSSEKAQKELASIDDEITSHRAKLNNPAYVEKAPAAVVEKTRRRLIELEKRRSDLSAGTP